MKSTSKSIHTTVAEAWPALLDIRPETAGQKSRPDAWSKKEILGHLIDSAANNHQRFVRATQNVAEDFPPYDPNRWVAVQRYNEMNWADLVDLFIHYNFHLCRVIDVFQP